MKSKNKFNNNLLDIISKKNRLKKIKSSIYLKSLLTDKEQKKENLNINRSKKYYKKYTFIAI